MPFHPLGFLSCLAYLALCLLIAASGAWKKYLRGNDPADVSTIGQFAGEDGKQSPPSRLSPSFFPAISLSSLFISCLISLFSFLCLPCGTLPSLFPFSGNALLVIGGLALALGFRAISGGWDAARRQGWAPLCFGVSLIVIARYARQRGVPGELYTLDAYVAMPIVGAAEGMGKLGIGILAAASLLALWRVAVRVPSTEGKQAGPGASKTLLAVLADELWMLAAIGFWVCLFFPFSFAYKQDSEIFSLFGLALNALFFWCKVLGLEWVLGRKTGGGRKISPQGLPFHVLIMLLGLGAWLLPGVAAE
jgi:hypothetical protein